MKWIASAAESVMTWIAQQSSTRKPKGVMGKVLAVFAILIALYHLYTFTVGTYDEYLHRVVHVGSLLAFCFLSFSFSTKKTDKVPLVDIFLALLTLAIMTYLLVNGDRLVNQGRVRMMPGSLTPLEDVMGVVLMLLLFEAGRRAIGSALGLIAVICVVYARFGEYFPGIWQHGGYSFHQLIDLLVFTKEGVFSLPVAVSSTYIILFLIFAAFVQAAGAGEFFSELALAVAGKARGGPAKVAVIGSALFGSISGSAAANVAVTGAVTIPMMKKAGFAPHFAGAVEAAASTGGLITPPIMGAVLFLMVEFVGVSYWHLCLVAIVPAILYFLGIFIQVHLYSVKHNLVTIETKEAQIPSVVKVLKKGWPQFLPFVAIVGLLVEGYSPIRAALWSIPVVFAVSWFRKETRIGIREILNALEQSMVMMRMPMVGTALAGIMMGSIFISGAANTLVGVVNDLIGGMLLPALVLTAGFCLFLGLTFSSVASYILTVILIVPAAVSLGVAPIGAHLFAVYFSAISLITPPVGGAFFQAAAIARAGMYRTGFQASRLAVAGFIVPFVWIYRPGLVLIGSPLTITAAICTGVAAVSVLALVTEGYFIRRLKGWERLLLSLGVFGFVFGGKGLIIGGAALTAGVLALHWVAARRSPKSAALQHMVETIETGAPAAAPLVDE